MRARSSDSRKRNVPRSTQTLTKKKNLLNLNNQSAEWSPTDDSNLRLSGGSPTLYIVVMKMLTQTYAGNDCSTFLILKLILSLLITALKL